MIAAQSQALVARGAARHDCSSHSLHDGWRGDGGVEWVALSGWCGDGRVEWMAVRWHDGGGVENNNLLFIFGKK